MIAGLQLVMEANSKLLTSAKVMNPRGCSIEIDKYIGKPVLVMKGSPSQTRVRIPREDRPLSSLRLQDSLLVAQMCLNSMDHFALEIVVSQHTVTRTKLVIGTNIKAARFDGNADELTTAYLPLIIPRSKWVQVVFHVAGITQTLFNLPSLNCIDTITLSGTGKVCSLFTSSDEQCCIDATPEGMALFAVPAYDPPIWKTATASAEHSSALPVVDARCSASTSADLPGGAAAARCGSSPSTSTVGKTPTAPPRLQPLNDAPSPQPSTHLSPLTEMLGSGDRSCGKNAPYLPGKCDYIRLVDEDDATTRSDFNGAFVSYGGDQHRQQAMPESTANRPYGTSRGTAEGPGGGLNGWEQPSEERVASSATPANTQASKPDVSKRPPRKIQNGSGSVASADNERMQRIIASRKRRMAPLTGAGNGSGDGGRGNGSRRQQRMRRRMRTLRANEQKVNKAAAAKALIASELPLAQRVSLTEEVVASTPICGYGFGYLGVLKPNGEYEEDEDANLNLEGALTLLSDGE